MSTVAEVKRPNAAPNPDLDPSGYLIAKGWKPLGLPPYTRDTCFLDPTKPENDIEEVREITRRKVKDKEEIVRGVFVTQRAFPMMRERAILVQMERDAAKESKK